MIFWNIWLHILSTVLQILWTLSVKQAPILCHTVINMWAIMHVGLHFMLIIFRAQMMGRYGIQWDINNLVQKYDYDDVTSLVECYEMVLAIIMSVPENVWDESYRTCSSYLHKCYWGYWLVTAVHKWHILHSHIVFTQYLGIRHEAKYSIMHFIQQQQKYSVFTGVAILIIYVPKRTEFITLYLEITCAYYIPLDNRDLQSCQVGQGKDVAITNPAQSTLCVLGHQAFPRLASGLDSMWHTSTRGFWSKKNSLIWILIARQCVSAQYLLTRIITMSIELYWYQFM